MDKAETERLIREAVEGGAKELPDYIRDVNNVFCGCGSPEMAWEWILEYLQRADGPAEQRGKSAENGAEMLCMYLMNHLGLTEHGSGIRYSWLTAKGEFVLGFLKEHGVDWDNKCKWVDSDGCSYHPIT